MISFLFLTAGAEGRAYEKTPGFSVDGKAAVFSEVTGFPYITDAGKTMMPVRICLDSIGCEVDWDDSTKTVISRKGDTEIDIPTGKNILYVNQKAVVIDTSAVLENGRTYLPLRTVLEAYGYRVDWNGDTRTITASSAGGREFTPFNINGGTTGIFSRKQLAFSGFNARLRRLRTSAMPRSSRLSRWAC